MDETTNPATLIVTSIDTEDRTGLIHIVGKLPNGVTQELVFPLPAAEQIADRIKVTAEHYRQRVDAEDAQDRRIFEQRQSADRSKREEQRSARRSNARKSPPEGK